MILIQFFIGLYVGLFATAFSIYLLWSLVADIRKRRWKVAANAALLIPFTCFISFIFLYGLPIEMDEVIEREGLLSFLILAFLPFGLLFWWAAQKSTK